MNRNFLLESSVRSSNKGYLTRLWRISPSEGGVLPDGSGFLAPNKTYTMTICITPGGGVTRISPFLSKGMRPLGTFDFFGIEKQIISKTFTATYHPGYTPQDEVANAYMELFAYPNDDDAKTSDTIVHWAKLEEGTEVTGYCPAIEDVPSYHLYEDMFERGMIHIESAQGLTYPEIKVAETVPDRIRSKELISVNADAVAVHVADGVAFCLTEFKDGKYLGINENYHSWQTKDDWIPLYPETNQIALAFRRVNNQHILPSEIAQICGGGVDVLNTKSTASITMSRVNDGADAFTIVYDSPSGLEFSDTVKSIAITAKIFKGGKELTDAEVNKFGAIKWYQVGVDAAIATGKTLTLTAPKEVYATLEN